MLHIQRAAPSCSRWMHLFAAAPRRRVGYRKGELEGCNVSRIMPAPFSVQHDGGHGCCREVEGLTWLQGLTVLMGRGRWAGGVPVLAPHRKCTTGWHA